MGQAYLRFQATWPVYLIHSYVYLYIYPFIHAPENTQHEAMAVRFSFLFISSLLLSSSFWLLALAYDDLTIDTIDGDDVLIRQVVDHDNLLNADYHFTIFKRRFQKAYATKEEHDYRFSVFKANLRMAKRHQKLDPSAVHGVTQFSDLTPQEFRRNFLGVNRHLHLPADTKQAPILPTNDLPKEFDWREHGAVAPVKNQVRALLDLDEISMNYFKCLNLD